MGLKKVFNVLKEEGIIIPKLNKYLMSIGEDEDRGHGWNSPSGVSSCIRAQFYTRTGCKKDGIVEPRVRRIFDNGHNVHDRLQGYLENCGLLILREVPVYNKRLKIMGHCDGVLALNKFTIGILEIKSINDNQFKALTTAKPEHKEQAHVYMMCLEELRKEISSLNENDFTKFKLNLLKEYKEFMETFIVSGRRFSKEEKINNKLQIMEQVLDMLYKTPRRIETMVILYENKNDQDIKEFVIKWNDEIINDIVARYELINKYVENNELPPRPEGCTSKSSSMCRYCNFTLNCFK